jgi:hypothetical protein
VGFIQGVQKKIDKKSTTIVVLDFLPLMCRVGTVGDRKCGKVRYQQKAPKTVWGFSLSKQFRANFTLIF